jgi:predicted acetyltransferase/N-acetylglutamate synthase-like GNAT family acetyltransferase
MQVRDARPEEQGWIAQVLVTSWGSSEVVSRGRLHDAASLPALVAEHDGELVGLLTYEVSGDQLEVVTLDALRPSIGAGTALLEAVEARAEASGCARVWLITTNDNLAALRFYQRRGFRLVALHVGAADRARSLKPGLPELGADGIALHDEIEVARLLRARDEELDDVRIEPLEEENKSVLGNLLQLYRYDFSSDRGYELTEHGTFVYRYLDAYFFEPGRRAWLIRHRGFLAGFALIRELPDGCTSMAEFFVVRAHRRSGVGRRAATMVFSARPGEWELGYDVTNEEAAAFWPEVVASVAAGEIERTVAGPPVRSVTQVMLRFFIRA